jgi:hypothetical protein
MYVFVVIRTEGGLDDLCMEVCEVYTTKQAAKRWIKKQPKDSYVNFSVHKRVLHDRLK